MEASSAEHVLSREDAPGHYQLIELFYPDLPQAWPHIGPMIEMACEQSHGAFDAQSVVLGVRSGEYILLAVTDDEARLVCVLVCAVGRLPTGTTVFEVLLAGGHSMKDWLPYEHKLDDFARARGCTRLRAIGRKSLLKRLPEWRLLGVMLEREL